MRHQETLPNLLRENRRFEPPEELVAEANVKADAYEARADRLAFWGKAAERLTWHRWWDAVLDDRPFAKWFVGVRIDAAYTWVGRRVEAGKGDGVAFHWVREPEDESREITYPEFKDEIGQTANALTELGGTSR